MHPEALSHFNYPIEYFPPLIQAAIREVHNTTQAPIAMVGSVVLAAISLACQQHAIIKMPDGRIKPCSLYLLTIAESGERKSTVNDLVMKPFIDFESAGLEEYENIKQQYDIEELIWNTTKNAILSNITKRVKNNEDAGDEELRLNEHVKKKPRAPIPPKVLYNDITPEAIQYELGKVTPSAGLIFDEASIFFGGRVKNDLGFLNKLWDGVSYSVVRRNVESFTINNARLTVSLMTQHDVFMKYFKKHGEYARSSGFLARFLIATPQSTQGHRLRENKIETNYQYIDDMHQRISELLKLSKQKISIPPVTLTLSKAAHLKLEDISDFVETKMSSESHSLSSIKDFSSKFSDNMVRLAALFHFFTLESGTEISEDTLLQAIGIVGIYVHFTDHLFSTSLSTPEQNAKKLHIWLMEKYPPPVGMVAFSFILRIGPYAIRNKKKLEAALTILIKEGKVTESEKINSNGSKSRMISNAPYWELS
jgi:hypothetical protein